MNTTDATKETVSRKTIQMRDAVELGYLELTIEIPPSRSLTV